MRNMARRSGANVEARQPIAVTSQDRLYQELARQLLAAIASGQYAVGDRLPAERELAAEFNVSRPTVREAIIALEVQGLVEVRVGSGAYVRQRPDERLSTAFDVTAFELTEARLLFEGEAAALAATQISEAELTNWTISCAISRKGTIMAMGRSPTGRSIF